MEAKNKQYVIAFGQDELMEQFCNESLIELRSTEGIGDISYEFHNFEAGRSHLIISYTQPIDGEIPKPLHIDDEYDRLRFVRAAHAAEGYAPRTLAVIQKLDGSVAGYAIWAPEGDQCREHPRVSSDDASLQDLIDTIAGDPDLAIAFRLLGYPLQKLSELREPA